MKGGGYDVRRTWMAHCAVHCRAMGAKIEYINLEGLRVDGRRPNEIRNLRFQLGIGDRADGTCYFEQGNTKVRAAALHLMRPPRPLSIPAPLWLSVNPRPLFHSLPFLHRRPSPSFLETFWKLFGTFHFEPCTSPCH